MATDAQLMLEVKMGMKKGVHLCFFVARHFFDLGYPKNMPPVDLHLPPEWQMASELSRHDGEEKVISFPSYLDRFMLHWMINAQLLFMFMLFFMLLM